MSASEKLSLSPPGLTSTKSRDFLAFPAKAKDVSVLACAFSLLLHAVFALGVAWLSKRFPSDSERDSLAMSATFDLDVLDPAPATAAPAPAPTPVEAAPARPRPFVHAKARVEPTPLAPEAPSPVEATEDALVPNEAALGLPVAGAAPSPPAQVAAAAPSGSAAGASLDTRSTARFESTGTGTQNRARPPMLAGGARWDCPFPREADEARIEEAVVTLRVEIATSGAVQSVDVARDPGDGFGREARRCAFRKRWAPGLDRHGQPTASASLVNVRFQR